eukprot:6462901-Amphidinium_carterae.2
MKSNGHHHKQNTEHECDKRNKWWPPLKHMITLLSVTWFWLPQRLAVCLAGSARCQLTNPINALHSADCGNEDCGSSYSSVGYDCCTLWRPDV